MKLAPKISSIGLSRWIYAALLWLYPPRFRREFGTQMRQDFALVYQAERRGRFAFWAMIGKDIIGSLWREYRALLPQSRWWWLRMVAAVSVGVGVYILLDVLRVFTKSLGYPDWFIMVWWSLYALIHTVGITLPLWFGLWTLPASGRTQRLVRGASLLLGAAVLAPQAIWFIEGGPMFMLNTSEVVPLLGAWEPLIVKTLLPAVALLAILVLSAISLRWPSHRWWSIAMVLIYLAPALIHRIAAAGGFSSATGSLDETTFWNVFRIQSIVDVTSALGWIFLGVKLWMSIRPRTVQDNVPAVG
jgi:hypothetical protein